MLVGRLIPNNVEEILHARANYFMGMISYLEEIQKGQLPPEEVEHFLADVVDIRVDKSTPLFNDVIQTLDKNARDRRDEYLNFLSCLRKKDPRIVYGSFMLQMEMSQAQTQFRRQVRGGSTSVLHLAELSFDDGDFLQAAMVAIKAGHPELMSSLERDYEQLRRLIKVQRTSTKFSETAGSVNFQFHMNWAPIALQVKSKFEAGLRFSQLHKGETFLVDKETAEKIMTTLQKMTPERRKIEQRAHKPFDYVQIQVELFFEVQDLLQKMTNLENGYKLKLLQRQKKKDTQDRYTLALIEVEKAKGSFENSIREVKELAEKNKLLTADLLAQLAGFQTGFNKLLEAWPPLSGKKKGVGENHDENLAKFHAEEAALLARLGEQRKQIQVIITEREQKEAARLEEIRHQEALEAEKARLVHEATVAEQKAKTEQRNLAVQTAREAKKEQKKEEKASQARSAVFFPATPSVTLVNDELLQRIDDDDLILIDEIMHLKPTVKYETVCNLITRLGGSVEEVGNGSSHKRIRLGMLYFEISSYASKEKDKAGLALAAADVDGKAPTASGGMARPHGHAHTSGNLSSFNLKPIRKALINAKLTVEDVLKMRAAMTKPAAVQDASSKLGAAV